MVEIKGRRLLALVTFLGSVAWAATSVPQAAAEELNIIGHAVHKRVSEGPVGDVTKDWKQRTGVDVTWITFGIQPLFERLVREASLGESSIDIAFLLNSQANANLFNLLEPLNAYQEENPIEDFEDLFPGMVDAMTYDGKLYGIPFRHTPSGLHYNKEYFKERGIPGPPKTMEQLFEYARKLTYTRPDGKKVFGLILNGTHPANVIDLARGYDGDMLTLDYRLKMNEPGMVKAVTEMRKLFEAGAYPKNFMTLKSDDINTWMQTGRAAMSIATISKTKNYNHKEKSQFPGKMGVTNIPISAELADKYEVAPAKVEFWSMVVLKNSKNKKRAWDLIREMMKKEHVFISAQNGNGPVRNSVYERSEYMQKVGWAGTEQKVLKVARVPVPPFAKAPEAQDIFLEEYQAAILGMKSPQEAMDDAAKRIAPLLDK